MMKTLSSEVGMMYELGCVPLFAMAERLRLTVDAGTHSGNHRTVQRPVPETRNRLGYEFVMGVPSVYQPLVSLAVSELLAITPQERRMMANPLLAR